MLLRDVPYQRALGIPCRMNPQTRNECPLGKLAVSKLPSEVCGGDVVMKARR